MISTFLSFTICSTILLSSLLFSLLRASVRIVSESAFYLGFLWALMNPKKETWHDKAGQTLVVNAF